MVEIALEWDHWLTPYLISFSNSELQLDVILCMLLLLFCSQSAVINKAANIIVDQNWNEEIGWIEQKDCSFAPTCDAINTNIIVCIESTMKYATFLLLIVFSFAFAFAFLFLFIQKNSFIQNLLQKHKTDTIISWLYNKDNCNSISKKKQLAHQAKRPAPIDQRASDCKISCCLLCISSFSPDYNPTFLLRLLQVMFL